MKGLALLLLAVSVAAAGQDLRIGTAEVDITPPVGAPMAGYYISRVSTGTHDPLHAKAFVLSDGRTTVAIVACDLVALPRDISEEAREIVQAKIHLAPDHIMITATHAHTTPVIVTKPSRYNLEGEQKRIAEEYTRTLAGKIAEAILKANAKLIPAQMLAASGTETTLSFNRRYFMKDGSVGWNPGKLNADIRIPAGPVDPSVPVLFFRSAGEEKPIAAYVNFGLHQDTTGGLEFSADFSYTLAKILKMAEGEDFCTLFAIGAAGNVNHIDVARKEPQEGYEEAARIGAVLAGDVLRIVQSAPVVANPVIRVSDSIVKIPVPTFTPSEIESANQAQASFGTAHAAPFLELVKAARVLELNARHGEPIDAEVQVFTFGDQVAIVGFPGEMFAEFGLQMKEDSPFPLTIVAELANGADSYIPNRVAYEEGNYEPTSARLQEGGGETLVDAAFKQLLELARRPADAK